MSGRRVLALYALLVGCFAAVVCRLYWLCSHADYAARAAAQSVVTLALPARRGNFYDCEGHLLTGFGTKWTALCVPGGGNYTRLFSCTDAAGQALLYQKRNAVSPFLLTVDRDVSPLGISCWPVAVRYAAAPLAVQLIGYVDGDGRGAAGLEAAFDAALSGTGEGDTLTCLVNAQGRLRSEPEQTHADSGAVGVQLTLSRPVQRAAEAVAGHRRAGSRGDRSGLHLPRLVRGGRAGVPLCGRHPAWGGRPCSRTGKKLQRILYPAGAGAGGRAGPCAG